MAARVNLIKSGMKKRHIVVLTTFVILFVALIGYHAWSFFELKRKVESTIKSRLVATFHDRLTVDDVNFRFGTLYLRDVYYELEKKDVRLWIEAIQVDYNLATFILGGFRLERANNAFILHRPRLTFLPAADGSLALSTLDFDLTKTLRSLSGAIDQAANFMQVIAINRGEVLQQDLQSGATQRIFQELNGSFETTANEKALLRLSGRLHADRKNVQIDGTIDYANGGLDSLKITVNNYDLARTPATLYPSFLQIDAGALNGSIRLERDPFVTGLRLSGQATITGGRAKIANANIVFDDINLAATLSENEIRFVDGDATINGSPLLVEGHIEDLDSANLQVMLASPALDLATFLQYVDSTASLPLSGSGQLRVLLDGPIGDPRLAGVFEASDVAFAEQDFRTVRTNIRYAGGVLRIDELLAENAENSVEGWGEVRFEPERRPVSASFIARGDFTGRFNSLNLINLPKLEGMIVANVAGVLESPRAEGNFAFDLARDQQARQSLSGRFLLRNWDIDFEARTPDNQFATIGKIDDLMSRPHFDLQLVNAMHLASKLRLPATSLFPSRYRLDIDCKGYADDLDLSLKAALADSNSVEFYSDLSIVAQRDGHRDINGTLGFFPDISPWLSTEFEATYTDSVILVSQIGRERWLNGNVTIDLKGERAIDGVLRFQKVEIDKLVGKDGAGVPKLSGRAFGELRFQGSIETPVIDMMAWVQEGFMRRIGVFEAEIKARMDEKGFTLSQFDVDRNNAPFLRASGTYDRASGQVDARIRAREVDANTVLLAIAGKDSVLGGMADINVHLSGNQWPIPAYGYITIRNGNALWFTFDELHCDLGSPGDARRASTFGEQGLQLGDITYTRGNDFILRGRGLFPFNEDDSMKVELSGRGNILAVLHDFSDIVTETSGAGQLELAMGGPYPEVRLLDSRLRVNEGTVLLSQVARRIGNIEADIVTRDRFIELSTLYGDIGDARIQIRNTRETLPQDGHLGSPLIINGDWMSLGTLEVITDPRGLPLHVPGLMENGEIGRFHLRGKQLDAPRQPDANAPQPPPQKYGFLVGGPWQHPVFWGEVLLRDVNLTYPFLENYESTETSIITAILYNADWDVIAIAEKDNHYVRNMNYGISNFYVNLGIDDLVSRMHFTGILRDTTTHRPGALEMAYAPEVEGNEARLSNGQSVPLRDSSNALSIVYQTKSQRSHLNAGLDTTSFRIVGRVTSSRGTIEYLDLTFRVDQFGAEWDQSDWQPVIFGQARTTVSDSSNYSQNVYLRLYGHKSDGGQLAGRDNSGRLENVYFELESDNMLYNHSKVQLLAALGISFDNMRGQATDILTSSTDKVLFRQLFRPVERKLERSLGLDMVRLQSRFTRNFLDMNRSNAATENPLAFFRSTKLTVGKYLSNRMYLLYTGQVAAWPLNYKYQEPSLGLRHTLGFEYRFNPTLLLQVEYDYNSALIPQWREDKKIWLRHSFPINLNLQN